MPVRISTWMVLIALVAIGLGCMIGGGRWYQSLSDFERSSLVITLLVYLISLVIFGAIVTPLFVMDFVKDILKRRRDALATRMAVRDGLRSQGRFLLAEEPYSGSASV
jgi:hypothetical protein